MKLPASIDPKAKWSIVSFAPTGLIVIPVFSRAVAMKKLREIRDVSKATAVLLKTEHLWRAAVRAAERHGAELT